MSVLSIASACHEEGEWTLELPTQLQKAQGLGLLGEISATAELFSTSGIKLSAQLLSRAADGHSFSGRLAADPGDYVVDIVFRAQIANHVSPVFIGRISSEPFTVALGTLVTPSFSKPVDLMGRPGDGGDLDQDGLSVFDELRMSSDPDDSDTDKDGLLDGEDCQPDKPSTYRVSDSGSLDDCDGDGWLAIDRPLAPPGDDCNDEDPDIHPQALDQCADDVDADCDESTCRKTSCFDSDPTDDIYTRGYVVHDGLEEYGELTQYDRCYNSTQLGKYWCYESPQGTGMYHAGFRLFNCPFGCDVANGICFIVDPSDGGMSDGSTDGDASTDGGVASDAALDGGVDGSVAEDAAQGVAPSWIDVATYRAIESPYWEPQPPYSCGVRANGTLWCWPGLEPGGASASPIPVQVGTDADWSKVAIGRGFACGVRSGQLYCWGGSYGSVPTQIGDATDWTDIGAGYAFACGLRGSGRLACFGRLGVMNYGTEPVAPGAETADFDWQQISVGFFHACALAADGSVYCWGLNTTGAVRGDGSMDEVLVPTRVYPASGTDPFVKWVEAGTQQTCVVDTAGRLRCWGCVQDVGIMNHGRGTCWLPMYLGVATDWTKVSLGSGHGCATKTNGERFCWGRNEMGQYGNGATSSFDAPVATDGSLGWSKLAMSRNFGCGLRDGDLFCWGDSSDGKLGQDEPAAEPSPVRVGVDDDWVSLSVGSEQATGAGTYACGLKGLGEAWCWGVLGPAGLASPTPARVGTAADWMSIEVGAQHVCGVREPGTLWCWGYNAVGEVGTSSRNTWYFDPVQIGLLSDWRDVSVGPRMSSAVNAQGELWAWGSNAGNALGIGSEIIDTAVPVQVATAPSCAAVSRGNTQACLIGTDKTLWCWGGNQGPSTPTQVGEDVDWLAIDVQSVAYGVRAPGTVWALGSAQVGAQVGVDTDWVGFGGGGTVCGVKSGGVAWCMGGNDYGQLGNGTSDSSSSLLEVSGGGDWNSVASGGEHTCGVKKDGSLWCWGRVSQGRLGTGGTEALQPQQIW
ncbi:MAG: hypothetical protein H6729_05155 [Deltaproteobacteria bacterium]|nr:hypothetical protein [Deltaproteobacteria bacterium]